MIEDGVEKIINNDVEIVNSIVKDDFKDEKTLTVEKQLEQQKKQEDEKKASLEDTLQIGIENDKVGNDHQKKQF